jgi:peptidoglycan/LPS O-acetylase OafA/YrhL
VPLEVQPALDGVLGVNVLFVLSAFLITRVLLEERASTCAMAPGAPALLVLIVTRYVLA